MLYLDVRRQKVLALLVRGMTYGQIAEELGITKQKVYNDVKWLKNTKRIDIELIRTFNWNEIMRLLPDLTVLQQAKLRIEIQRILEPKQIKQHIETTGTTQLILRAWHPHQEEDIEDHDGDTGSNN